MLLDLDLELMLRVLRVSIEKLGNEMIKEVHKSIIAMWELTGSISPIDKVKETHVHGVKTILGTRLIEGNLNDYEKRLLRFRYIRVVPNIKSERLIEVLSNPYSMALCN